MDGLITHEIGETLARYSARVPAGEAIVELGSYKGMSTCYLAGATTNQVYAVDAWDLAGNITGRFGFARPDTYAAFLTNTADYPNVTPVKAFSVRAAQRWRNGPVGLLYGDADHKERSVWEDVNTWYPHLTAEAPVVLDDWGTERNPGVERAANRLIPLLGAYSIEAERLAVFRGDT
jgi:hypothetical protein